MALVQTLSNSGSFHLSRSTLTTAVVATIPAHTYTQNPLIFGYLVFAGSRNFADVGFNPAHLYFNVTGGPRQAVTAVDPLGENFNSDAEEMSIRLALYVGSPSPTFIATGGTIEVDFNSSAEQVQGDTIWWVSSLAILDSNYDPAVLGAGFRSSWSSVSTGSASGGPPPAKWQATTVVSPTLDPYGAESIGAAYIAAELNEYEEAILALSPVRFWQMHTLTGTAPQRVLKDASTTGDDVTLNLNGSTAPTLNLGAGIVPGGDVCSVTFSGNYGQVGASLPRSPLNFAPTDSWTYELWVKRNGAPTAGDEHIWSTDGTGSACANSGQWTVDQPGGGGTATTTIFASGTIPVGATSFDSGLVTINWSGSGGGTACDAQIQILNASGTVLASGQVHHYSGSGIVQFDDVISVPANADHIICTVTYAGPRPVGGADTFVTSVNSKIICGGQANEYILLRLDQTTGRATIFARDSNGSTFSVSSTASVCDNLAHMIDVVWDGSGSPTAIRLYVDGVLQGTISHTFAFDLLYTLFIGGSIPLGTPINTLNATLNCLSIHHAAYAAAQISNNYTIGARSHLVAPGPTYAGPPTATEFARVTFENIGAEVFYYVPNAPGQNQIITVNFPTGPDVNGEINPLTLSPLIIANAFVALIGD